MADISRNTTPAWQDPHLKDRGDYTEQDIQNIQEKGGILPDFTLDEAEETHLFARVAQALSKTLTRQGLAVRHEAKAAVCFDAPIHCQAFGCVVLGWLSSVSTGWPVARVREGRVRRVRSR